MVTTENLSNAASKPDFPTVAQVFNALRPIMDALPECTQSLDDDLTMCWSQNKLRLGDIREMRRVWNQAMAATESEGDSPVALEVRP